jgi:ADP-ribose pyrophosphatase YjhB (NUDIX family)
VLEYKHMQDIPDHAEIVFEGIRCTIYHWNQVMYDGTTRVFEAVTRPPSATIIATVDGKIAFQRQTQPHRDEYFLCLPGGWADVEGEVIEDTAKRELLEETGLVSEDWELWKVAGVSGFIHWDNYVFVARNCTETDGMRLDGGEQIENGFITLDEFLSLVDHPQFRHRDLIKDLYQIRDDKEKRDVFEKLLGIS